jgi:CheY-like chemotaxis protein
MQHLLHLYGGLLGVAPGALGHDAIEAAGGQEALDLLERDRDFDLLMVDLAMPNMHGDEFAERARGLIPVFKGW